MKNRLDWAKELYVDAVSKRQDIDNRIDTRNKLYRGENFAKDYKNGGQSDKEARCYRNMCFELIESQINNAIPMPKITPRDATNSELARMLEGYLKMEMDRLNAESLNDEAERAVLKQGSVFYLVGWDETQFTPTTRGEAFIKLYPIESVYPQPGVRNIRDAEYIFVSDWVHIKKIKELYNKDVVESPQYKGMAELITMYYFNDRGYVSKIGWIDDEVVFDEDDYEARKIKVCSDCDEPNYGTDTCKKCGSKNNKYVTQEYEILTEDLVKGDPTKPDQKPEILAPKGTPVPYYRIKRLPFVLRKNISDDTNLYGVSDIDLLETNQDALNKITTKISENILKGGSIVAVPEGLNIPKTNESLKVVKVKDPRQMDAFKVVTVQANVQQDTILQEQLYRNGRDTLGITESFQGKRDTTAESGVAKQVSAAQASGRLESKRRMKDAAYGEIYELLFMYLLAYCDEKRTYSRMLPDGSYVEGTFSRYNYLDGTRGNVYYNDRFLFSVDTASILSTSRDAMWRETASNLQAGTFGNPADPNTLITYWNVMKGLGYPLAGQVLASVQSRTKQLPQELQDVILNNPQILQAVQQIVQEGMNDVQNSKQ